MESVLEKLVGGHRRSIGRSDEVAAEVLASPEKFTLLFSGITNEDPLVRFRAADAVEKITAIHPEWLQPYRETILGEIANIPQQEVRWHMCQLIPRLELDRRQRVLALEVLSSYLSDQSRIVRTFALQAMADLAGTDPDLKPGVILTLEEQAACGFPSVESRCRRLLARLKTEP